VLSMRINLPATDIEITEADGYDFVGGGNSIAQVEWQLKSVDRCHEHGLRLLSECPKCGARFKVPAL
jgi:hypothetical protein